MSDDPQHRLSRAIGRGKPALRGITIGGDAPIVVQSMTNTDTADVAATVAQVRALARAGSELVRITVNTAEAAAAVPRDSRQARRRRAAPCR